MLELDFAVALRCHPLPDQKHCVCFCYGNVEQAKYDAVRQLCAEKLVVSSFHVMPRLANNQVVPMP